MRPRAAWLAVLTTFCLLLSTLHLGAITGQRPHGFGHWQDHAPAAADTLESAPGDESPEAGHHDDLPAKKRRATLDVVSGHDEPAPAPTALFFPPPSFLFAPPALPARSSTTRRVTATPAPPCQRHRGQAPPTDCPPPLLA